MRADVGKNACSWEEFAAANYRPENVGMRMNLTPAPLPVREVDQPLASSEVDRDEDGLVSGAGQ